MSMVLGKGQVATIEVDKAERDAINQVLVRHGSYLDSYERDLLKQLLAKIDQAPPHAAGHANPSSPIQPN